MQKHSPPTPKSTIAIDVGNLLAKWGLFLLKAGSLGLIVSLAYFVYAIYGGALQSADPARAMFLIARFGELLAVSAIAAALGVVLITLEELTYAVLCGIGGLGLMLGIPYLVASNLTHTLTGDLQRVAEILSKSGTNAGIGVLSVVGLRVVYEIYLQVREAPERRRRREEKEAAEDAGVLKKHKTIKPPSVVSPCWELPYCHERIREICPAFKARRPCWRHGIGCNCDPKLIETLIRMGSPGAGKQSGEMARRQGAYIRSDLEADAQLSTKADRTIPCSKCAIYAEHQRLKFKFINPLTVIGTLVAMGALFVPITNAWGQVAGAIVQVARTITLNSGFDAGQWFAYLQDDVVKIFFFILVTLLVLSYVLKFTEWVVLEKKL